MVKTAASSIPPDMIPFPSLIWERFTYDCASWVNHSCWSGTGTKNVIKMDVHLIMICHPNKSILSEKNAFFFCVCFILEKTSVKKVFHIDLCCAWVYSGVNSVLALITQTPFLTGSVVKGCWITLKMIWHQGLYYSFSQRFFILIVACGYKCLFQMEL